MSDEKVQNFIVPVKVLLAITVESTEENLAENMEAVVKKLQENTDLRDSFFKWSEDISGKMDNGSAIFIPSTFLAIKDQDEADIAINFVTDLHDKIVNQAAAESPPTEDVQ